MYNRLLKLPFAGNKSFFLFGPRGTGKTTHIRLNAPKALYFDLLESRIYLQLLVDPQSLEALIPEGFNDWIVLDEVQKVPALLNEVHRLIENKKHKFILTGSSARKLRRKGVNLLAGRALTYHMYPLTAQELGDNFSLEAALQYGCLTAIFSETNPEKYLDAYVHTYLQEEVLQEGLTRDLGDFARFLEIASFSQGAQINMSAIAREAHISQKTASGYFNVLEDLLLCYRLNPFTKKAKRRLITSPKFYYFDVGIYRNLRPKGPFDRPEEIGGIALETLFFQELKAINDYYQLKNSLHYWRSATGIEVDFVAYGEKGLFAFEIKHTKQITNKHLSNLKAFKEDYGIAKLYLIYGGDHREYHGEIEVIPFAEALKTLPKILNPLISELMSDVQT